MSVQAAEMKDIGVTRHAEQRAVERLGVEPVQARNHLKLLFQSAYYQGTTPSPRGMTRIYDHHKSSTRLIVSAGGSKIITVYKMPEGLSKPFAKDVDTEFLRPVLTRELRKIKRLHTRDVRSKEVLHAEALQEMAEMVLNRAKARNPNTRELIAERIAEKQQQMQALAEEIKRLNDDYAAKIEAIEAINGQARA